MVAWQGEETRQVLTARDDAGRDFRTQGQIGGRCPGDRPK